MTFGRTIKKATMQRTHVFLIVMRSMLTCSLPETDGGQGYEEKRNKCMLKPKKLRRRRKLRERRNNLANDSREAKQIHSRVLIQLLAQPVQMPAGGQVEVTTN